MQKDEIIKLIQKQHKMMNDIKKSSCRFDAKNIFDIIIEQLDYYTKQETVIDSFLLRREKYNHSYITIYTRSFDGQSICYLNSHKLETKMSPSFVMEHLPEYLLDSENGLTGLFNIKTVDGSNGCEIIITLLNQ